MRRLAQLVRAIALAGVASWASGAMAEYRSIAAPAVMYDAPSKQARKLFAAPRGMPVEVVSTLGAWVKVRDVSGDVAWVERGDLAERRSVVASAIAAVRANPQETAAVVLHADRGVLLELVDPSAAEAPAGWVRVRHRDGGTGYVRATEVWGL